MGGCGSGSGGGGWSGGNFTGGGKGPGSQRWAAKEMEKAAADMLRDKGLKVPTTDEEIELRIVLVICGLIVGSVIGWFLCLQIGPDDPCPAIPATANPETKP